jgi:hypothetical protein
VTTLKQKISIHFKGSTIEPFVFFLNSQGVPEFDSVKNLATSIVSFIYICSVEHSATNFPQYEQYGFPPNFPAKLNGHPEEQHVILITFIIAIIRSMNAGYMYIYMPF